MSGERSILIVGGGTAGWLTAAYLARALEPVPGGRIAITVLESPEIATVGVGEGTFPTIRETLRFIGIDEADFLRETSATFKQGVRFVDWLYPPGGGERHVYDHPFEPPLPGESGSLVPYWLLKDPAARPSFAEAVCIQSHVAGAGRGPKEPGEQGFDGPLSYAYHFDARRLVATLARRAEELGVVHLKGAVRHVGRDENGLITHVATDEHGSLEAALFIDCSGFRAELIGGALGEPLHSVRGQLFTDRAIAARVPYPDARRLPSYTIATAHEAGWIWDIGLAEGRGIGCVYSSEHLSDERAARILRDYAVVEEGAIAARVLSFEPGYRQHQWIGNCVAVGLSAGFLEPLEATGVVMIEAAVAMIAEMFPHAGPIDAPARRFNGLMRERFENIAGFLKLHYCLSRRPEPFWRDNANPASWPDRLVDLLGQWRHRPPGRFDLAVGTDPFAYFNYQYVLYGMEFATNLTQGRNDFLHADQADRHFARVKGLGQRAAGDLPAHRDLIDAIRGGA